MILGAGQYVRNDIIARDVKAETVGEFVVRLSRSNPHLNRPLGSHWAGYPRLQIALEAVISQRSASKKRIILYYEKLPSLTRRKKNPRAHSPQPFTKNS